MFIANFAKLLLLSVGTDLALIDMDLILPLLQNVPILQI